LTQNKKVKDLVDYIESSPSVWSGAAKEYRKTYQKYLSICRDEIHDAQLSIFNKEVLEQKYVLTVKLEKLRKVLTSCRRAKARSNSEYIKHKLKLFGEKLDKF
jgi:hypothetical protein